MYLKTYACCVTCLNITVNSHLSIWTAEPYVIIQPKKIYINNLDNKIEWVKLQFQLPWQNSMMKQRLGRGFI